MARRKKLTIEFANSVLSLSPSIVLRKSFSSCYAFILFRKCILFFHVTLCSENKMNLIIKRENTINRFKSIVCPSNKSPSDNSMTKVRFLL